MAKKSVEERTDTCTKRRDETGRRSERKRLQKYTDFFYNPCIFSSSDTKDYALKQIEGTGISMSACRELAVSKKILPLIRFLVNLHDVMSIVNINVLSFNIDGSC